MLYTIFINFLAVFLLSPLLSLSAEDVNMNPDKALEKLMSGNARYVDNILHHPNRAPERRESLSEKQLPFAIIVGCSDSRVSPELIFDQGIGDIFVVRDAGNVIGPIEIASVEYSAEHLHSSIIFVLGHENCGAVKAVLAHQTKDIEPIAEKIESAIKNYYQPAATELEASIKANVRSVVAELKRNDLIAKLIKENKLGVVGGYYHLSSGKVEMCCTLAESKN